MFTSYTSDKSLNIYGMNIYKYGKKDNKGGRLTITILT